MNIFVTGASGFVGRAVVAEAVRRGHAVTALVRPATAPADSTFPNAQIVRHDLRTREGLDKLLPSDATVIHLAASKTGDLHTQLQHTVVGTENLLDAMRTRNVGRIVVLGSFTVYDCSRMRAGTVLDESCPIVADAECRDAYTFTKVEQERLVSAAAADGMAVAILRAGAVWGPEEVWSARLGQRFGRYWIALGRNAPVPLVFVDDCASAVLDAAEQVEPGLAVANVVGDALPTQREHLRNIATRTAPKPSVVGVPWPAVHAIARILDAVNARAFDRKARIPNFLSPAAVVSRHRPFRYSNAELRRRYAWAPITPYREALHLSLAAESQARQ